MDLSVDAIESELLESDGEEILCDDVGENVDTERVGEWCGNLFSGPFNLVQYDIPDPIIETDSDHLHSPVNSEDDEVRERHREFNPLTDYEKRPFRMRVGDLFPTFRDFRQFLVGYAIQEGFDYAYLKNESKLIVAKCKAKGCKWTVRASTCSRTGGFRVKTIRFEHICGRNYDSTKVSASWLAKEYMNNLKDDPNWSLNAFKNDVERKVKATVSRQKCYRAKRIILQSLYGTEKGQYTMIRDYAIALMKSNPGTTAVVDVDEGKFRRFYLCLDACKTGFIAACRPLVTLDGCHLKGSFGGQLLSAVGLDGNNNMFPIAFAVVESENKQSWSWFLERLVDDIGSVQEHGWTFMSDQQKGLIESFKELMPWAHTRICVRHLYENFKKEFKGKLLKDYLWNAAKAPTEREFNYWMEKLKQLDLNAYHWLVAKEKSQWTRHCQGTRVKCDTLLSNIAETFNSWIIHARDKPIITMCEIIRRMLMKRFQILREGIRKYGGDICPRIQLILEKNKRTSFEYIVHWDGQVEVEVEESTGRRCIVNLERKTCSCRRWDFNGIPCAHACAGIYRTGGQPERFVDNFYKKESMLKAYENTIHVVPDPNEWEQSPLLRPQPPVVRVPPGRPKKTRKKAADEPSISSRVSRIGVQIKCSKCGHAGHNAGTCKSQVVDPRRLAKAMCESARVKNYRQKKRQQQSHSTQPIEASTLQPTQTPNLASQPISNSRWE